MDPRKYPFLNRFFSVSALKTAKKDHFFFGALRAQNLEKFRGSIKFLDFVGPVFGPFLERFRLENCQKGPKNFGALRAQKLEKFRGSINSSVRSWRNKKGSSG